MNVSAGYGTDPMITTASRGRAVAILRGLGSAIAVLAIIVGIPLALWVFVGWPLPHELPSWSRLYSAIANGDIPDRFWIGALAILMWVAWAAFTASVVLEAIAQVRGWAVSIRGPRLTQAGAARLVTAIVIMLTLFGTARSRSTAAAAPSLQLLDRPVATATAPRFEADPATPPAPVPAPVDSAPSWTVQRTDTLWHIAETTLGDGERWPEIFALNVGRPQPDGQSLQEAWTIQPGWNLTLPGDAHLPAAPAPSPAGTGSGPAADGATWTLGPGDSLWSIAQHTTGDGALWPEIWALNEGHPQPDGRLLTDPDVIQDGTMLVLPTSTAPPSHDQTRPAPNGNAAPKEPSGPALPNPEPAPAPAPTTGSTTTPTLPTRPPAAEPRAAPQVPMPGPPTSKPPPDSFPPPQAPAVPIAPPPGSSNGRTRPPGSPTPGPQTTAPQQSAARAQRSDADGESPLLLFAELAAGGLTTAGAVLTIRRLRRAQQRHRSTGETIRLPDDDLAREEAKLRAGADIDGLEWLQLVLRTLGTGPSQPACPAQLVRADGCSVDIAFPSPPGCPPPELWIESGDRVWSFDEAATDEQVVDVAERGQSPFSLLVPWGRSDAGEVLIDLEAPGVMWLTGDDDARNAVLDGLLHSASTQDWNSPIEVLCCGFDDVPRLPNVRNVPALAVALEEVEQRRKTAVCDLETVGASSPFEARTSQAFAAWSPLLVLAKEGATVEDVERLDNLAREPHPCAAVVLTQEPEGEVVGWSATAEADGTVTIEQLGLTVTGHGLAPNAATACSDLIETALDTESWAEPSPALASPVTAPLPVDNAQFVARILGTVDVVDANGNPVDIPRSRAEELVVYLAVHGEPVSLRRLDEDLWPDATTATRNKALSEARLALGEIDGSPLLLPVAERRVELTAVTTDWHRLRELAAWGTAHPGPEGDEALGHAVSLIRGMPFESGRGQFNWTASIEQRVISDASDAAAALAERRLDAEDSAGAEEAARSGLAVAPGDERCWRLLLQSAHLAGDARKVDLVAADLQRALEEYLEPFGTLDPETIEVLARVRPRRRDSA